jgi:hypothetical protein
MGITFFAKLTLVFEVCAGVAAFAGDVEADKAG